MSLTIDLPEKDQQALLEKAKAAGVSVERYARELIERGLAESDQPDAGRAIWELLADKAQTIPADEMREIPSDAASQVDHYLYGHPKR